MPARRDITEFLKRFWDCDEGTASLEFILVFPIFFGFFLATYESGLISARHVMLERGVDLAVRDVRIGKIATPSRDVLRARICEVAAIIPDCLNQLEIETFRRDPRSWVDISSTIRCVDRGDTARPVYNFTNGGNNELIIIRACVRIDPMMPTTGLGKAIVENNSLTAAGGSYALISTAAFVVEPYRSEDDGT